jgi:hypothetical protein
MLLLCKLVYIILFILLLFTDNYVINKDIKNFYFVKIEIINYISYISYINYFSYSNSWFKQWHYFLTMH